jgi:putative Mg2+ transporter-C (MgtC) family protein
VNSFLAAGASTGIGYFAARAMVALALGAVVGLERQWRQRMAGLRTNALVALGSSLFELLGTGLAPERGADPTRIAAYVVSGVGFLGAGVLIRDGGTVRGINTAATIWCSAAIGVLAGAGFVVQAVIGALFVVLAHLTLRPVARRIDRRPASADSEVETVYRFRAVCRAADEAHIRVLVVQALSGDEYTLRALSSKDLDQGHVEVVAELHRYGRDDVAMEAAVSRLSLEPSVSSVTWNVISPESTLAGADEE